MRDKKGRFIKGNDEGFQEGNTWGSNRKGAKQSVESKLKMRQAHTGKKLSDGHKRSIGLANKGRKFPEEFKIKMSKVMVGNKHGWKGGVCPEYKIIRASTEYKLWRTAVFERDKYTCAECNKKGGQLNVHHIKPFSKHVELRFEIGNGITLCEDCHKKTDTYLKKKRVA